MLASRSATLASAFMPRAGWITDAALIVGFAVLTVLLAQVSFPIPGTTVPFTGQTLAVLLAGATLGARRGALSQASYVAAGAAGLPVFANGTSLSGALARNTWGFLIGFIVAAFVVGWLAERGWSRNPLLVLAAMPVGSALIYACGLVPFMMLTGRDLLTSVNLAVVPFLLGDAIKAAIAAGVLPGAWRLVPRR